jgi:hypothetical protein
MPAMGALPPQLASTECPHSRYPRTTPIIPRRRVLDRRLDGGRDRPEIALHASSMTSRNASRTTARCRACRRRRYRLWRYGPNQYGPRCVEPARYGRALPVWGRLSRPSLRGAPGRRCWSRWSARSAARTNDLDRPEDRCTLVMGRSAAWGRPALPGCSTTIVSSATTFSIWVAPVGSAVASVLQGRLALRLARSALAGADRGKDP